MRSASLDASAPRVSRCAILGVATANRQRVFSRKERKGGYNPEMIVNHTIHGIVTNISPKSPKCMSTIPIMINIDKHAIHGWQGMGN